MPIAIQCKELEPGMRLFEPVVYNDRVMLPGGKALTREDVDVLRRRFPDLHVRIGDPILDERLDFDDDKHDREVAETVRERISQTMAEVDSRYAEQASLKGVDFQSIKAAVSEIMKYIESNPVSAALVSKTFAGESFLADHTGNVFYLSMLLGCAARTYISQERQKHSKARDLRSSLTMDLTPLGLGAMFMDLGLVPFRHLYQSDGELSHEDWRGIRQHPLTGAEPLPENFSAAARMIIRSHHERFDGSGYPQGLSGDKIHVLARVIRIADAYVTATEKDVHGQAMSEVRALWEMSLGPNRRFYDRELIGIFAGLIQPFPIGAKLRLKDGRRAVVVKYNKTNPFRPIVVIAYDKDGNKLSPEKLREPEPLDPRYGLEINSYAGEDLSYLHNGAAEYAPLRVPPQPQTLFDTSYP